MKCPYCGHESENQRCEKCNAWIPAEQSKEPEPTKVYKRKNKE